MNITNCIAADERSYKCNYNVPSRELPRFVPPIRVRFVESEIDVGLVQSVLDIEIEEDSGAYTLVGICEDMDMDMTEVEEVEERKGIGEGVEARGADVKEIQELKAVKGVKDEESNARKECEGKHDTRRR
ncbi:uncharacterized protein EAF02_007198 [Botrytis sinoallii]|uniref:uncharacterized protein n=1 Tax=Botrytis sinoallii TaxID=1463999 RepID=UPI0018FF552F|nr:uncharacterized protein EAF02_007198 [Botrytis sinoallii]KAF7880352.1 hypothetical protein EAF02_007198 [Botrytis sinoallii]